MFRRAVNRPLKASLMLICICLGNSLSVGAEQALPDGFYSAQPRVQLYMAYAQFKMANYPVAASMWREIEGAGRAEAAFNLGILYEQGMGVDTDMAQALHIYLQGAEAGSRAAAYQLGLIYLNHPDFGNRERAEHWLTLAALDGESDALELLQQFDATPHARSDNPMTQVRILISQKKIEQALLLLRQLAEQTPPNYSAVTRLAWLYETGIGVERDISQAATLFRQAAENGFAEAQYALALMLQTGIGQPLDLEKSNHWLKRAADQGYQQALEKLQQ